MEASLCARGWAVDLLEATQTPAELSAGYVEDVRHRFLRRWEGELERIGLPLLPSYPQRLSRSRAMLVNCHPFMDPSGNQYGADFCFGYGADSYSFKALNYRNPYLHTGQPVHFLHRNHPLMLGNFAVGVGAPASSTLILPPPDVLVAGVAEVATAKSSSVILWLGVRFCSEETDAWVVDDLSSVAMDDPLLSDPTPTYAYGTVFSQQFAGTRYELTPEEENSLRQRVGYPVKGKPIREQMLFESVCKIFGAGNVIRRYRGRELEGLELDIWVPAKKLGIEYQGEQHFKRIPHWHGADGLKKQQERDLRKRRLCEQLGVRLAYFGPDDDLERASVVIALRRLRIL